MHSQHSRLADLGVDPVHLRLAALVAPDQRGRITWCSASSITSPCIWPGEPDALHVAARRRPTMPARPGLPRPRASHQFSGRCSAHSGCTMRMSSCGDGVRRHNLTGAVYQQRAAATGADIDPEPHCSRVRSRLQSSLQGR